MQGRIYAASFRVPRSLLEIMRASHVRDLNTPLRFPSPLRHQTRVAFSRESVEWELPCFQFEVHHPVLSHLFYASNFLDWIGLERANAADAKDCWDGDNRSRVTLNLTSGVWPHISVLPGFHLAKTRRCGSCTSKQPSRRRLGTSFLPPCRMPAYLGPSVIEQLKIDQSQGCFTSFSLSNSTTSLRESRK